MLTVKGFDDYNDNNQRNFTDVFTGFDDMEKWIREHTYGKEKLHLPADWAGGAWKTQRWSSSFSSHLYYRTNRVLHGDQLERHVIAILDENGHYHFSSGNLTDDKMHISAAAEAFFKKLDQWKKADDVFIE